MAPCARIHIKGQQKNTPPRAEVEQQRDEVGAGEIARARVSSGIMGATAIRYDHHECGERGPAAAEVDGGCGPRIAGGLAPTAWVRSLVKAASPAAAMTTMGQSNC